MTKLQQLVSDIRHELQPGVHTYGLCSRCQVESARGGGICAYCKEKELAKLVGVELAADFVECTKDTNTVMSVMEEKLDED